MKIEEEKAVLLASQVASTGSTIAAAGKALGFDKPTTYRISATPHYRRELARKTLEIADAIVSQTIATHTEAMDVLRELMHEAPPEVRLGAAKAILASFSKIHETASKQILDANAAIDNQALNKRLETSLITLPTITQSRN